MEELTKSRQCEELTYLFGKGTRVTTNGTSCFEVLAEHGESIFVRDMLSDDLLIMKKAEHEYKIVNESKVLKTILLEVLNEVDIKTEDMNHIYNIMNHVISKLVSK